MQAMLADVFGALLFEIYLIGAVIFILYLPPKRGSGSLALSTLLGLRIAASENPKLASLAVYTFARQFECWKVGIGFWDYTWGDAAFGVGAVLTMYLIFKHHL